jgi:hypothetical protein
MLVVTDDAAKALAKAVHNVLGEQAAINTTPPGPRVAQPRRPATRQNEAVGAARALTAYAVPIGAACSLEQGLDETRLVKRRQLPRELERQLPTTNEIENLVALRFVACRVA